MVCLLRTMLRRMAAIHLDQIVEVSCTAYAVDLLVFVRGRA